MAVALQGLKFPSTSWEEAEAFVRCIIDRTGCSIDGGILEAVVALNLLGFPTCQSCEGHLDGGLPYPWIDFETDEFPTFSQALEDASREGLSIEEREAKGAQLVAVATALPTRGVLYARLEELLSAYYRQHPAVPEEWRLVIHWSSPILFRLMPWCGYEARDWDDSAREQQLSRVQAEMRAFTVFLKQLWQWKQDGF
ncbi:MAG TPA: hypothetical protein VFV38_44905 [Ktedonobacteraceae bacterium]|nr:hypothetical protein [Ktedonobacteraceae bacterium]